MFYARSKDGFKKTTAKIEHNQARKNIINLVKEFASKDSLPRASLQTPGCDENTCKNQVNKAEFKIAESDIKSGTSQSPPTRSRGMWASNEGKARLAITHTFGFSIQSSDVHPSKAAQMKAQYIQMLEQKIEELEQSIKAQHQDNNDNAQVQQVEIRNEKLTRFYHRARNVLIQQSVELVDLKNLFRKELEKNQSKLRSLNQAMTKGEELLEVYRIGVESTKAKQTRISQRVDLEQLKDLVEYQQKTLDFLRKQNPLGSQFNELKLLRHQINRISLQNERLIHKLSIKSPAKSPARSKGPGNQQATELMARIGIYQSQISGLEKKVKELQELYQKQEQKTYKLREEKEFLGTILDEARVNQQNTKAQMEKYEKQIHRLKMQRIKSQTNSSPGLSLSNEQICTTEQLCRELKPYPRYHKLLVNIINEYEFKINELQTWICNQRQLKQKYMKWSSEVYHLLESAHIPEDQLEKHKERLFNVENRVSLSKVQKLLRVILALSIGVDSSEMESELEEYVITLKGRNQVIKEVDLEDGSSVAFSERVSYQDFEE